MVWVALLVLLDFGISSIHHGLATYPSTNCSSTNKRIYTSIWLVNLHSKSYCRYHLYCANRFMTVFVLHIQHIHHCNVNSLKFSMPCFTLSRTRIPQLPPSLICPELRVNNFKYFSERCWFGFLFTGGITGGLESEGTNRSFISGGKNIATESFHRENLLSICRVSGSIIIENFKGEGSKKQRC